MGTKKLKLLVTLSAIGLLIAGCGPGQIFGPTPTLTPTLTPTATLTPTPMITSIEGRVYFKGTNQPVTDVYIYLNDPRIGLYSRQKPNLTIAQTTTDSQGYYSFTNIIPGEYVISLELTTETRVSTIEWTLGTSTASFEGHNEAQGTYLYIVEPEFEVLLGRVVEQDFIITK